jgi:hypothetical protein
VTERRLAVHAADRGRWVVTVKIDVAAPKGAHGNCAVLAAQADPARSK